MPTTTGSNGFPYNLTSALPAAVSIASSTNASPIVVTTASPHGMHTGDVVQVEGHLVNTAADGQWETVVLSSTTFQLVGTTGNGVGAGTGTARSSGFGSEFNLLADGDDDVASTWNVPYEALADRTALLHYELHCNQEVYNGGFITIDVRAFIHAYGTISVKASGILEGIAGAEVHGVFKVVSGTRLDLYGTAGVKVLSSASVEVEAGGRIKWVTGGICEMVGGSEIIGAPLFNGTVFKFADTTELEFESGSTVSFDDGSALTVASTATWTVAGQVSYIAGSKLDITSGTTLRVEFGSDSQIKGPFLERSKGRVVNRAKVDFKTASGTGGNFREYTAEDASLIVLVPPTDGSSGGYNVFLLEDNTKNYPGDKMTVTNTPFHTTGSGSIVVLTGSEAGPSTELCGCGSNDAGWADFVWDEGENAWIMVRFGGGMTQS